MIKPHLIKLDLNQYRPIQVECPGYEFCGALYYEVTDKCQCTNQHCPCTGDDHYECIDFSVYVEDNPPCKTVETQKCGVLAWLDDSGEELSEMITASRWPTDEYPIKARATWNGDCFELRPWEETAK